MSLPDNDKCDLRRDFQSCAGPCRCHQYWRAAWLPVIPTFDHWQFCSKFRKVDKCAYAGRLTNIENLLELPFRYTIWSDVSTYLASSNWQYLGKRKDERASGCFFQRLPDSHAISSNPPVKFDMFVSYFKEGVAQPTLHISSRSSIIS